MKRDFRGVATKYGIKCADGRTLAHGAFDHQNGQKVPLVFQHNHKDHNAVLGHAFLVKGDSGLFADCYFNDTESGKNAKLMVQHGDIEALSIFANELVEAGGVVSHGQIKEVSLVLSGANPGAVIQTETIVHGGELEILDEATFFNATDDKSIVLEHDDMGEPTPGADTDITKVFDGMTPEQKMVVKAVADAAVEDHIKHSELEGGNTMKHGNIFTNQEGQAVQRGTYLSHDDMKAIFDEAKQCKSFKEALKNHIEHSDTLSEQFLSHAGTYGITNIEYLFPDAQKLSDTPDFIQRETTWVDNVLAGVKHLPYSRFKMVHADITADEARAKGYITGALKKEEVFPLLKRQVSPTTVYKKQKLDRDNIIDITEMNVVNWLWNEMQMMLREELARAIMFGDGRSIDSPDKVSETNLIPAAKDADLYNIKKVLQMGTGADAETAYYKNLIEQIILAHEEIKGSGGTPVLIAKKGMQARMLLLKDGMGRDLYASKVALHDKLDVKTIEQVENLVCKLSFKGKDESVASEKDLECMMLVLNDYSIGTDAGGPITKFDDFDIDYNQYKYLLETRCSGALTKPFSCITFWKKPAAGTLSIEEEV